MTDTLETAAACGVSIRPRRRDEPTLAKVPSTAGTLASPFDRLIASWYPMTYLLNSLNRGLGLADAYPFVLSPPAVEKLRFVHDTIALVGVPAARRTPAFPSPRARAARSHRRKVDEALIDVGGQRAARPRDRRRRARQTP